MKKRLERANEVSWPDVHLVLENAEQAARQELTVAKQSASYGQSAEDHWRVVDDAATKAARESIAPRELSPRELRLVVAAAEAAHPFVVARG